jgi:hypothetical protein
MRRSYFLFVVHVNMSKDILHIVIVIIFIITFLRQSLGCLNHFVFTVGVPKITTESNPSTSPTRRRVPFNLIHATIKDYKVAFSPRLLSLYCI